MLFRSATNTLVAANMAGLSKWAPTIDDHLRDVQKSLQDVGDHVAALEAGRKVIDDTTPQPEGRRDATHTQGNDANAHKAKAHALVKGMRHFRNSPVNFDLGEHSGTANDDDDDTPMHESRGRYRTSRPPKSDFPRFDGENPRWWKKTCEKYFAMYDVEHETWASYATIHFVGNAVLWLSIYGSTKP